MTRKYMDFAPVNRRVVNRTAEPLEDSETTQSELEAHSSGTRTVTAVHTTNARPVATVRQVKTVRMQTNVSRPTTTGSRPMTAMPGVNVVPRSRTGVRAVGTRRTVVTSAGNVGMVSAGRRTVATNVRRAPTNSGASLNRSQVKLGEIEDLNPKFVTTNVPKRPLSDGTTRSVPPQEEAKAAKQKRVGGRFKAKKAAKATAKQEKAQSKNAAKEAYNVPKSPFINQDKVVKRPLSKNVYQNKKEKVVAPVEKKTDGKPVTIIAKPKKDSKVGLIVTIILTIILGAVAGTVAFLLLPK